MCFENIYEELRYSKYPVFIWGAGSMSVEVAKRLDEKGIHPAGRFIDTKIDQSHIISNADQVFSLDKLKENYSKINVIMGHGHYEKAFDMKSHSLINEVYIITNPYTQYKGPSLQYVHENFEKIDYIKKRLIDERSRYVLEKYIAVSTTNDIRHLLESDICVEGMLGLEELNISATETYVDIGAWEGDTIDLFLNRTNNRYDHIYGVEPAPCTFARLKNKFIRKPNISLFQCGLGLQEEELYLSTEDSQSTYLSQSEINGCQKVSVTTMDNLFTDKGVSLVKIFVPFMFLDILKGGKNIIKQNRPRLIIFVSSDDKFLLYDTVQWITNLDMNYKLALRFDFPMPTRLILYAY